jgi:hypothetical protein
MAAANTIVVVAAAPPMMKPTSFAPFAVLLDALISTPIMCAPTSLTATAQSPVLTCFPLNVAFVAETVTLRVTASSRLLPTIPPVLIPALHV